MNLEINLARRLASLALAAALAFGGLHGLASHDVNDAPPTDEVAGATWSLREGPWGKDGPVTLGGTWS